SCCRDWGWTTGSGARSRRRRWRCCATRWGRTIGLVNAGGAIATSYGYEPFGATAASGAASSNSHRFTGREQDPTGLYYLRHRYYNPMLGRFLSPDPIGIAGGINLYAYAGNNPLNVIDPLGLKGSGGGGSDWACMKCSRTGKGWGPKGNGGRGGGRGAGGGGGDHDGLEGDVGATADAVDAYQAVMFGGAFDQGALEDVALMGAFLSAGGGPDLSNAPAAGFVTTAAGTPGGVPTPGERVAGWALVILSDA